jgi:hypothetical protein
VNFAFGYTGDGWPDYLVATGRAMVLYVNPRGQLRRWDKYNVLPGISGEIAIFKDIDGDGKPDAVFGAEARFVGRLPILPIRQSRGSFIPFRNRATARWRSMESGRRHQSRRPDGPRKYHPVTFGRWPRVGGAEMGIYDVNGDGLNDVVTGMEAHGWGLAWYEQKRDPSGTISFVEHMIMDDYSKKNPGNVTFSELHALTIGDVDGDGIPDVIVGKRVHAHLESYTDPDSFGPAVLYWFRTVRNPKAPGGAEFVPELIHNRSGVGSTVSAVDLNRDGAMDIVTSTNRGTFIFWGKPGAKPARGEMNARPRSSQSASWYTVGT